MENLSALLLLASLFLLIIGFFSPKTSLFWYKKERTKKLSLLIYGLCVIVFFALFGITAPDNKTAKENLRTVEKEGLSQKQKDSVDNEALQERTKNTFTAGQLMASYTQNEVNADNSFRDKTFYVVGYVDNIGKSIGGDTYVTLKTGDILRKVECYVEDQTALAALQPGQKITVYGTGGGLMIVNVLMQNCTVVKTL